MVNMNIEMDLREEISRADRNWGEYHSSHEGYAVIQEELDELWDEIKKKDTSKLLQYREAMHVACTAIRFCKMIQRNYKGVLP